MGLFLTTGHGGLIVYVTRHRSWLSQEDTGMAASITPGAWLAILAGGGFTLAAVWFAHHMRVYADRFAKFAAEEQHAHIAIATIETRLTSMCLYNSRIDEQQTRSAKNQMAMTLQLGVLETELKNLREDAAEYRVMNTAAHERILDRIDALPPAS